MAPPPALLRLLCAASLLRLAGGDLTGSLLASSTAAALQRALLCTPPPPEPLAVAYLCGASNATPPWACPGGDNDCATQNSWPWSGPVAAVPPAYEALQVRTAGYPRGAPAGATACALRLLPLPGASLQLTFQSFRLNSQNFFSVQEYPGVGTFDPKQAPYLLGAASGSALPPAVQSGAGNGLVLSYFAPEADSHDPLLCDGVVATVTVVPQGAPAQPACAAAASCGACASIAGCVWCDTSGVSGQCLYTGVRAGPLGGGSAPPALVTLPAPPLAASVRFGEAGVLCNASLAYAEWTACPAASDRLAAARQAVASATAAVMAGQSLSLQGGAGAAAQALTQPARAALGLFWQQGLHASGLSQGVMSKFLGQPYAAAAGALTAGELEVMLLARYAFVAVLVLFLVLLVLLGVIVLVKRATALRTGNSIKYVLELLAALLCACKALEFLCLALLLSAGVGDLPAQLTSAPAVSQLLALATYAADAQYLLIVLVAYMTTPTVPNSKHSLCACTCVLLPSVLCAVVTAVLVHYSRVSLVLPSAAGSAGSPLGPPLSVEVCYVALPAAAASGAPATALAPVHMSLPQVGSALLFFASALSSQTFSLLAIASEDLTTTTPLHFRPPLLQALGSILCLLTLPVEVAGLWVVRCLGLGVTAVHTLATAHLAPAALLLAGVCAILAAVVWQMRLDARVVPTTVKEGLRLQLPREAEEAEADAEVGAAKAEVRSPGAHSP